MPQRKRVSLLTYLALVPKGIAYLGLFVVGFLGYLVRGRTNIYSFEGMRRLYCATNGHSNDTFLAVVRQFKKPYTITEAEGLLGKLSAADITHIAETVRAQGYYRPEARVPPEMVAQLRQFAETTPCHPTQGWKLADTSVIYDRNGPVSVRYDFDFTALLRNPAIQRLAGDLSFLAVAQAYFKCKMYFDHVGMWWSTPLLKEASSAAAQLYHVDMDRINWLNFFVYLSDVTPDNGPHCLVAETHRRKPRGLLRTGRFSDEELRDYYPPEQFKEFTGPAGTILVVDTRGFHKGKQLLTSDRLMFEVIFATSLFGANYERVRLTRDEVTPPLRASMERFPYSYSNIEVA